ncbi:NUDIX hydrolase [Amycolatopsis sp.]|uniref:NUDIX hydrolase n=1 Tax=Amycolatopsis sp. TaxID=37632 RepID=UPI002B6F0606|nr:NUDIX domain-containing protein [Amycolatopsis sp.]HVV07804.1 NUDIX domain-containing protein [Amycolatopsis sp.]
MTEEYRRRTARVLLLDEDDRLLLFRFANKDGSHCWLTPGGGVEEGESLPEAASRELLEETGLRVPPEALGSCVALTSGYVEFTWAKGVFRDDFFFHRVAGHDVDTRGFDRIERRYILGHRWWPTAELAATTEVVYPFGLVPLLAGLTGGTLPAQPVRLPWHH